MNSLGQTGASESSHKLTQAYCIPSLALRETTRIQENSGEKCLQCF
jgi:hypothetical protein